MKTILTTTRLQIREFIAEDADALARVICDPETMRFYPMPFERADADHWIERNQRRYETDGHGLWAVIVRKTGEVIGDCGVTLQDVEGERLPEIGYHLRRDQWGRGLAAEAARACRDWAFLQRQSNFLISLIRPENEPSRRVAERNGMQVWKQVMHAGLPHDVFRIDRAQWQRVLEEQPASPSGCKG
jgi:[ribosomal protein S5]-alanine N-acetyltransferase